MSGAYHEIDVRAAPRPPRATLGATRPWTTTGYATAPWKARSARRCPPPPDPVARTEPSPHFAEAQIQSRLTNPAKQNIITSIRGSKRQVPDIKSESVAGFLLECVAGFVGIRIARRFRSHPAGLALLSAQKPIQKRTR
jgi:hypothetical protein